MSRRKKDLKRLGLQRAVSETEKPAPDKWVKQLSACCSSKAFQTFLDDLKTAFQQSPEETSEDVVRIYPGYGHVLSLLVRRYVETKQQEMLLRNQAHGVKSKMGITECKQAQKAVYKTIKFLFNTDTKILVTDGEHARPFQDAASNGLTDIVRLFINTVKKNYRSYVEDKSYSMAYALKAFVAFADRYNATALLYAVRGNHAEIVGLLLDAGAEFDELLEHGLGTVQVAAAQNALDVLRLLETRKIAIDWNCRSPIGGDTPLVLAARNGAKEAFTWLLSTGADLMIENDEGHNALLEAACQNQLEILKIAFKKRQTLCAGTENSKGQTPLTHALYYGAEAVARWLITKKRADLTKVNSQNENPLFSVVTGQKPLFGMELLRNAGFRTWDESNASGCTPLIVAAYRGKVSVLKALLKHGADPRKATNVGVHALLLAASKGNNADCLEALLKTKYKNAIIDEPSRRGDTALVTALKRGNDANAVVLLKHGAKLSVALRPQGLVLSLALMKKCNKAALAIFSQMRKKDKASLHPLCENDSGKFTLRDTPFLLAAVGGGNSEGVQLLSRLGAFLEPLDTDGCTPLLSAARNGFLECLKRLIEAGADVSRRDFEGRTALYLAVVLGFEKAANLLIDHIDPRIPDCAGNTPIKLARAKRYHDLVAKMNELYPESRPLNLPPRYTTKEIARLKEEIPQELEGWLGRREDYSVKPLGGSASSDQPGEAQIQTKAVEPASTKLAGNEKKRRKRKRRAKKKIRASTGPTSTVSTTTSTVVNSTESAGTAPVRAEQATSTEPTSTGSASTESASTAPAVSEPVTTEPASAGPASTESDSAESPSATTTFLRAQAAGDQALCLSLLLSEPQPYDLAEALKYGASRDLLNKLKAPKVRQSLYQAAVTANDQAIALLLLDASDFCDYAFYNTARLADAKAGLTILRNALQHATEPQLLALLNHVPLITELAVQKYLSVEHGMKARQKLYRAAASAIAAHGVVDCMTDGGLDFYLNTLSEEEQEAWVECAINAEHEGVLDQLVSLNCCKVWTELLEQSTAAFESLDSKALERACKTSRTFLMKKLLREQGSRWLHTAVRRYSQPMDYDGRDDDWRIAEMLLQLGSNPNGYLGPITLVHLFAECDLSGEQIVKLQRCSQQRFELTQIRRDNQCTPLMCAVKVKGKRFFSYLIEKFEGYSSELDAQHIGDGKTALHLAAESNAIGKVQALLSAGAQVDARDSQGQTAAHCAAANNSAGVFGCLKAAGLDLDCPREDGATALHVAAKHNHQMVVHILLTEGAKTDCQRSDGARPIDLTTHENIKERLQNPGKHKQLKLSTYGGKLVGNPEATAQGSAQGSTDDSQQAQATSAGDAKQSLSGGV